MSKSIFLFWFLTAALTAQTTITATATPSSTTFSYQIGAAKLPAAQTVAVKASAGTPAFTTAISGANSLWLTVSPDSGKLPASLSFQVNPTSMAVGSYSVTVTITVAGVATALSVNVTLNVTSAPSTLTVSPLTLAFTAPPTPVPTGTVTLSTSGSPISFTAAAGSTWLTVSPTAGVVLPGEQGILTVSVDPTGLNPQATAYSGKITVTQLASGTAAAKAQTITVTLLVNSSAPTITTIWPGTLPLNAAAQTITLRGTNFYSATTVSIQGLATPLTTTILSPTALLAVVPASQLTAAVTLNVVATNPAPGGSSTAAPLVVGNVPSIVFVGNVASYGSTSISPGEIVTIFGSSLGPATPATMSITNGYVDTTLGGVTVTVDSVPAPLLYVGANQITIQVPYEVTQGQGKQLIVTNGSNAPATSTVAIAAVAPGVFTADGSGSGLAAALNYSATTGLYSVNTGANPAKLGDIVTLYVTGEGDYNPTLNPRTGIITPSTLTPLPQLNPLPTVTIGGAAATVNYAGPMVGSILGLLQINVVVPATSTTGQAVPVVVTIGGTTANAVNLSVHP